MKILVNEKISQHKYKTPEGYLICVDSVLARTGNQTYRKNELFADSEDDSEIEVGRSPEEVFSAETLASFENKPITIEHPDEDVNVENYKDYSVGFVRDVKKGKFEDQDVILGTLVITDKDAIEGIENGEHVELSCGYDCDIEDGADGYQQKHIRGNHVALCEAGRAGIAKIIDSVNDERTSMTKEITKAISGLKSTLFNTEFVFESNAHGMTLTASDSYGIDPKEKSRAMRFVEIDVKAIESRLNKIIGYMVTIAKYSLYKERYSDPNAGLNCERIWLYGKKIRDSLNDEDTVKYKDYTLTFHKGYNAFLNMRDYYEVFDERGNKVAMKKDLKSAKEYVDNGGFKDAVGDAKKYAVEFTYDGDSVSNYLGQVWVYANSDKEALKKAEQWAKNKYDDAWNFKIVPKTYSNSEVIDSIEDANHLPPKLKNEIKKYLGRISTFVPKSKKDWEAKDFVDDMARYFRIDGTPLKFTRESIKGWNRTGDGALRKDYIFSVDGYDDRFLFSIYANDDYETTEVNAYFTDSVKDIDRAIFYKRKNGDEYILSIDPQKIRENGQGTIYVIEQDGLDFPNPSDGNKLLQANTMGSSDALQNYLRKKGKNCKCIDETPDEEQTTMLEKDLETYDVDPRSGESKDDFIARFMKETKNEYPDEKQRLAVAYSYWERKGRDSMVKDRTVKGNGEVHFVCERSNMYVRAWNKNKLTPEEVAKICRKYNISFSFDDYGYIRLQTKIGNEQNLCKAFEVINPNYKEKELMSLLNDSLKDSVKDINPDYANCLRELDKDVNQLYKLYQHGDKAPSTILHNMGYKEVGDDRFMMRSGLNKMIIEFDDFSDYIKYYVVDESGKIPKGYTVTKFKFYDSKPKDSIYALTVQGEKSKKLVRAKDAREAIDKYTKMFPKHKVSSVKKTDKFNKIIGLIKR